MKLIAEKLTKTFNDHIIFKDITFQTESGSCLAVVGPNGSGKTTLLRILSKLILPSDGTVAFYSGETLIPEENIHRQIGFLGPYLELYQDLTAAENLNFFARIRGLKNFNQKMAELLQHFGLQGREHDLVKTYSSGMKQRLKYVFALLHSPDILFIDEPRSNLDEEGIAAVYQLFKAYKRDHLLVLATNDHEDLTFADTTVEIKISK